jgi:hypothetical protein
VSIKTRVKKIWYSLFRSKRLILLDYTIDPTAIYSETNNRPHQQLFNILATGNTRYEQLLSRVVLYKDKFALIEEEKNVSDDSEPGWNNGHLPGLDIIILYSILMEFKPRIYIEIGSGTSTKVAHKVKKDNHFNMEIISIDPRPRKNIDKLADKIYRKNIQDQDIALFQELQAGDVVFFDGTHTIYPNSDVMWFFLEILPVLNKGVIVQIHDIYLPYDYPGFMLERYYSEQYLLGALLLNNPDKYEILAPNYFIYSNKRMHATLDSIWSLKSLKNVERHGGSFWFIVR